MTTTQLNNKVFPYILAIIDADGYDVPEPVTPREKLQFLSDTFHAEYGWHIEQVGPQSAMAEWFQGLASSFNLEFTNYDILQLAKSWGSLPASATERQEQKILDNYWRFMAAKVFIMFRRFGISALVAV